MNDSEKKKEYNQLLNTTDHSDESGTCNTVESTDRGSMASSRLQDYINKRKKLDQKTV